jgi:hypothetical protein
MPKLRISASVINFKDRALKTWKMEEWKGLKDGDVIFFGLYNDRDFAVFDLFKGNKSVFWCGTDIMLALRDYERRRVLKNNPCKHYCENELEASELRSLGLDPIIVPSFLDEVENYPVIFTPSKEPHIFLSGHDNREEEYGVGIVERIASKVPFATFHIYGVNKDSTCFTGNNPNVVYHGRVPEAQFNEEIKKYHCGLRTNIHDGFSEITAKNLLYGGYPITKIPYEGIWTYNTEAELVSLIEKLRDVEVPNIEVRNLYLNKINKFDFLCTK